MQCNALHLLREKLEKAQLSGDEAVREALHLLCAADHLQAMRHDRGDDGSRESAQRAAHLENRRRPPPLASPYETYRDYTNILRRLGA